MPISVNQRILDDQIRHGIGLSRVGAHLGNVYREDWRESLAELLAIVLSAGTPPSSAERRQLIVTAQDLNRQHFRRRSESLHRDLEDAGLHEADFQHRAVRRATRGADLTFRQVTEDAIRRILRLPIKGLTLADWLRDLEVSHFRRFFDVISEASALDEAVREIEGPRSRLSKGENNLIALVRSGFGHVTGQVRDEFGLENQDKIEGVIWTGVLDSRITAHICLPRDGKMYSYPDYQPVGHELPWKEGPGRIHFQCRSLASPVFKHAGQLDLEGKPVTVRDAFDGEVPAKMTAEDWLRRQPVSVIEEVFGKTRATLFRRGGLSAEEMLRPDGTPWTLDELRGIEMSAFDRAGISAA